MMEKIRGGQMGDATFALKLERTSLLPPDVPPIPVFHFAFTRVGNQVLLEPGYVDLVELQSAMEQLRSGISSEKGSTVVRIYVKEKYVMDRQALAQLRDAAEEILQGMPEPNQGGSL